MILTKGGDIPTMFSLYPSLGRKYVVLHGDGVSSRWLAFDLNSPTFMVSLMMGALVTLLIVARIPHCETVIVHCCN